jgi:hypothetical protein
LELRSADGARRLDRSASNLAAEHIRYYAEPNTRYVIRIIGFVNAASDYKVVVRQFLPEGSPNENAGKVTIFSDGSEAAGTAATGLVTGVLRGVIRFTVNPLTKRVTAQILR